VVGALPIVQNKKILRLNLADTNNCATTGAATAACTVNGVTATAGTTDSWTGGLTQDFVQLGVTDVEPAQLTNADFPTNYSASVFGSATAAQLKALPTSRIFDQVFGLAVNTTGGGLPANSSTAGISGIHLSKEAAANILNGSYSDWSAVPDATTGNAVASSSVGVTRIDREPGSGTRTATNIFFLGYQCGTTNAIQSTPGEQLNFSTADELTQANGIPGAIAYTSIDQILNPSNLAKWPNLALVTIDGIAPSTQAAAAGGYGFWFEATFVPNTTALGSGTGSAALATFLENSLPRRVAENEAKARLNTPRGRLGSTYFSCAGIGRFSHTPRSARTFFALRTFPSTLGAPYPAVSRFETLSAAEFDLSRVVSIPVLLVRRTGRAKVRSCRERFAPRRNPLTRSNRDALHDDHDPQHHRRSRLDSER